MRLRPMMFGLLVSKNAKASHLRKDKRAIETQTIDLKILRRIGIIGELMIGD